MTCNDFLESLGADYKRLKLLSDKNGALVLLLRNTRLSKDVILKKYSSPVFAYDELKALRHRNLPEIYDTFNLDDGQIVLEEYIEGITVAQVLESGTYTYSGAKRVLCGICSALAPLHRRGIVHRDIKAENVIISNEGRAYLIDFNASRHTSEKKSCDTVFLGTIGYAPPEQLGISQTDCRTDVYALGVLLNVMLTGEHPSRRLAGGKAKRIVLKCTSVSPEKRFKNVDKLMKAL
ncbi:MAG: serine/threonine protein kinase [Ruminococcaceae bacterium]|nr:serine/threonine protein kinase [Oscillospiraceae bacterium]